MGLYKDGLILGWAYLWQLTVVKISFIFYKEAAHYFASDLRLQKIISSVSIPYTVSMGNLR